MATYILSNRRASKFTSDAKRLSRQALDSSFTNLLSTSSTLVREHTGEKETDRRTIVIEAEPQEMEAKRKMLPSDVLLEPQILHYKATSLPLDISRMRTSGKATTANAGQGTTMRISVRGNGKRVYGAKVTLYLRGMFQLNHELNTHTDIKGNATFEFSSFWSASVMVVSPAGEYWSTLVRGPKDREVVQVKRLPKTGYISWWHRLHGVNAYNANLGGGIRVGVADTGTGPHPNLSHVDDQGAFIDGAYDPHSGEDVDSHGSHVAGIIGARPSKPGQLAGIAPGADMFGARVFPPNRGADQGDIANAIDHLSKHNRCDLINLSLGSSQGSDIERDAIIDALERGTLCICAGANDGVSPVDYPAKFGETIAISAIGSTGWGPAGSLASMNYPVEQDKYGADGLFLASFSNYGIELTGAGGGVGILSTVPARFDQVAPYASMDGTSMASPAACGALAALLSKDNTYRNMPRDITRAHRARAMFERYAKDIGLATIYQGKGVAQTK